MKEISAPWEPGSISGTRRLSETEGTVPLTVGTPRIAGLKLGRGLRGGCTPAVLAAIWVALSVVGTAGTPGRDPVPVPKDQARAALYFLKPVERANNEWGAFTLSDFLLEPDKGQMDLGYTNTTLAYVESARKMQNGRAAVSDFRSFSGRVDGTADFLPRINAGQPAGGPAPAVVATPAGPSPSLAELIPGLSPTKATVNLVQAVTNGVATVSTNAAIEYGPSNSDAPAPAKQKIELPKVDAATFGAPSPSTSIATNGGTMGISERQAIEQGFADKVVEHLHRQILHPVGLPKGQRLVFGVAQVSCQPGWRTVNNYMADLHVSLSYARKRTKSQKTPGMLTAKQTPPQSRPISDDKEIWEYDPNWSPSVYAVLPLTDSLEFDLSSRRQRELDLAGSLAATFAAQGMTGEAKLMARYIRRRDSNVETASLLPVASSYTDGGAFGFRIYPRPQGITNPGDPYAGAGNVLQPVSFPVLVAFLCDEEESEEKWTHLRVATHVAWIPVRGRFSPLKKAFRFFAPNYTGGNARSDLDLVEQAEQAGLMDKAQGELQCLEKSCDTDKSRTATAQLARRAFDSLRGGILGYERIAVIPTFGSV